MTAHLKPLILIWALATTACGSSAKTQKRTDPAAKKVSSEESNSPSTSEGTTPAASDKANDSAKGSSLPLIMGALGDSITRALNAQELLQEAVAVNWATGEQVQDSLGSHLARFKQDLAVSSVSIHNVATSGATSAALDDQLRTLVPERPNYVTIMIGANDACQWTGESGDEVTIYEGRVEDAVTRLIQANDSVRIVLASVPDLTQMYNLKKANSTCQTIWSFTKLCPELLATTSTQERRTAFHQRWLAMNAALSKIATRHSPNVRFADKVAAATLTEQDLAVDCFHPSLAGHKKISDLTWDKAFAQEALLGP